MSDDILQNVNGAMGAEPQQLAELRLTECKLVWGEAPCQAEGAEPCYRGIVSCQDVENFSPAGRAFQNPSSGNLEADLSGSGFTTLEDMEGALTLEFITEVFGTGVAFGMRIWDSSLTSYLTNIEMISSELTVSVGDSINTTNPVDSGTHHVAVVISNRGNTVDVVVDGELVERAHNSSMNNAGGGPDLTLETRRPSGATGQNSRLQLVRLWRRALRVSRLARDRYRHLPTSTAGLLAQWSGVLNDGTQIGADRGSLGVALVRTTSDVDVDVLDPLIDETADPLRLRYTMSDRVLPEGVHAFPAMTGATIAPTELKVGELGSRGTATASFMDFIDDDRDLDPFIDHPDRVSVAQGSHFARLVARHPYHHQRELALYTGQTRPYRANYLRLTNAGFTLPDSSDARVGDPNNGRYIQFHLLPLQDDAPIINNDVWNLALRARKLVLFAPARVGIGGFFSGNQQPALVDGTTIYWDGNTDGDFKAASEQADAGRTWAGTRFFEARTYFESTSSNTVVVLSLLGGDGMRWTVVFSGSSGLTTIVQDGGGNIVESQLLFSFLVKPSAVGMGIDHDTGDLYLYVDGVNLGPGRVGTDYMHAAAWDTAQSVTVGGGVQNTAGRTEITWALDAQDYLFQYPGPDPCGNDKMGLVLSLQVSPYVTLYDDEVQTNLVGADGDPVGYVVDSSGEGSTVAQANAAERPLYREGGADDYPRRWLEFDGVDDHLVLTGSPDIAISGEMTWAAWVYFDDTKNEHMFMGSNIATVYFRVQRGDLFASVQTDSGKRTLRMTGPPLAANNWYFFCMTFSSSSGEMRLYVNGQENIRRTVEAALSTNTRINRIGRWRDTDPRTLSGFISDFRAYTTALSAQEIADYYARGAPGFMGACHESVDLTPATFWESPAEFPLGRWSPPISVWFNESVGTRLYVGGDQVASNPDPFPMTSTEDLVVPPTTLGLADLRLIAHGGSSFQDTHDGLRRLDPAALSSRVWAYYPMYDQTMDDWSGNGHHVDLPTSGAQFRVDPRPWQAPPLDTETFIAGLNEHLYLMEKVSGPHGNNRVEVRAKDPLTFVEGDKAKFPKLSQGELNAALGTGTGDPIEIDLPSAVDVDDEYQSGDLTVRLGREHIRGTRAAGSTSITITERGYDNTEISEHDVGDVVQRVEYPQGPVHELLRDLLEHARVKDVYIPYNDWVDEIEGQPLVRIYQATISEPTAVKDLINELIISAAVDFFWDDRRAEFILRAIVAPPLSAPVIEVDEEAYEGTIRTEDLPHEIITQAWVWFGVLDPTDDIDERRNYRAATVVPRLSEEEDVRLGNSRIKTVLSRWIISTAKPTADYAAETLVRRLGGLPFRLSFELPPDRINELWTGDVFQMLYRNKVTLSGAPRQYTMQVMSAQEMKPGQRYRIVAQRYAYVPLPDDDIAEPELATDEANVNLRDAFDQEYTEVPAEVRIRILSGTVIYSDDTDPDAPSLDVGDWPDGTILTLIIEEGAQILGRGGNGGKSETPIPPGAVSSDYDGDPGGLAFYSRFPITVENNGRIAGGGGGGGGFAYGNITKAPPVSGGGGAGRVPGLAGTVSGSGVVHRPGDDGTVTEGGSGGSNNGVVVGGDGGDQAQPGGDCTGPSISEPHFYADGGPAGVAVDGESFITYDTVGDIAGNRIN